MNNKPTFTTFNGFSFSFIFEIIVFIISFSLPIPLNPPSREDILFLSLFTNAWFLSSLIIVTAWHVYTYIFLSITCSACVVLVGL